MISQLFERRSAENPSVPLSEASADYFGALSTDSGMHVSQQTATQLTAVFACVRVLSDAFASMPCQLFQRTDDGRQPATDHPAYGLLHDAPNPDMTAASFFGYGQAQLALNGNAYPEIRRRRSGEVRELRLLDANLTEPVIDSRNRKALRTFENGRARALLRGSFAHVFGLSRDGEVGLSPIAEQRRAIGLGLATHAFGEHFYRNGARMSVVLERPEGAPKLSEEAHTRLRKSFERLHAGVSNAGRVALLEEGTTAKPLSVPPEDAQFLESRKFTVEEIARVFGVPPHKIAQLERATYSNIEHQAIEFVVSTLLPWCRRWEQALEQALLSEAERREFYVKFNMDALLRGDYKTRMEGHAIGLQWGMLKPNEARGLEERNAVDGGEQTIVPLTHTTMANIQSGANLKSGGAQEGRADLVPLAARCLERVLSFEARRVGDLARKHQLDNEAFLREAEQSIDNSCSRLAEELKPLFESAGGTAEQVRAAVQTSVETHARLRKRDIREALECGSVAQIDQMALEWIKDGAEAWARRELHAFTAKLEART